MEGDSRCEGLPVTQTCSGSGMATRYAVPELQDRPLETSPEHKVLHAVAQAGSRLVGDRFLPSYLTDCLHTVGGLGPLHKLLLADAGHKSGAAPETITRLVAQAEDNMRWVSEMQPCTAQPGNAWGF